MGIGAGIIICAAFMVRRIDVENYNIDALSELSEEEVAGIVGKERAASVLTKVRHSRLVASICGIIMLLATMAGIVLMF